MRVVAFTDFDDRTYYVNPDKVQVIAPILNEEDEVIGARMFFSADHALTVPDSPLAAATKLSD